VVTDQAQTCLDLKLAAGIEDTRTGGTESNNLPGVLENGLFG